MLKKYHIISKIGARQRKANDKQIAETGGGKGENYR